MATAQPPPPPSWLPVVTRRTVGRRIVLEIEGELDIAGIDVVATAVDGAVEGGVAELWLDLSATSFMDSSGIHFLLATCARLRERACRPAVICPPGCVRRLFDVAGVSALLPLYESRSAANRAG